MATKVVYCDTRDLERDIKKIEDALTGQSIHAAMSNALNRTLTFVGAETKRQVKSEYTVKSTPIAKSLTKKRATRSKLTAEAIYKDTPLPLQIFKHKIPSNRYRSPVMVQIRQSGGKQIDYTDNNGTRQVLFGAYGKKKLVRRDLGQKNLKTAYTISVPQMVSKDNVYGKIVDKAEAKLIERMNHEIKIRMDKII